MNEAAGVNIKKTAGKILWLIIGILLVRRIYSLPITVSGTSMEPTYQNGEKLSAAVFHSRLKNGDVIVFWEDSLKQVLIKRITAGPGDTVELAEGKMSVNGEEYQDEFTKEMDISTDTEQKLTLKKKEYYVMGDNRNNSFDSRNFGAVKQNRIIAVIKDRH